MCVMEAARLWDESQDPVWSRPWGNADPEKNGSQQVARRASPSDIFGEKLFSPPFSTILGSQQSSVAALTRNHGHGDHICAPSPGISADAAGCMGTCCIPGLAWETGSAQLGPHTARREWNRHVPGVGLIVKEGPLGYFEQRTRRRNGT